MDALTDHRVLSEGSNSAGRVVGDLSTMDTLGFERTEEAFQAFNVNVQGMQ
jgi:hypothetical protein